MPTVKMKTQYAGPSGVCPPGGKLKCSKAEADALVEGRYAEYETAEAPAVEKAVTKPRRTKPRKATKK